MAEAPEIKKAEEKMKSVEQSEYEKLMKNVDMSPKYGQLDKPLPSSVSNLLSRGNGKLVSLPRYSRG